MAKNCHEKTTNIGRFVIKFRQIDSYGCEFWKASMKIADAFDYSALNVPLVTV
jgi:hypothetical protein